MRTISICLLAISISFLGIGQEKSSIKSWFFESTTVEADILPFMRFRDFVDEDGTLNPDNRIANLNETEGGVFVRPELKFDKNKFSLKVSPRFNMILAEGRKPDTEFYFQALKGKILIGESFYAAGGRYLKPFGTSIFINPSNPFFLDAGRLNPKIEVRPMDFVEFNWSTKKNIDFTLIANIGKGEVQTVFDEPFFEFSRRYGLLTEYYGDSYNVGAIASVSEEEQYHLGIYAQKNIGEAMVIWVDSAFEHGINRFYPVEGHPTELISFNMTNGEQNDDFFFSGLIGASYTLKIGPTINLEYYHNSKGYNSDEVDVLNAMITSSVEYNFDVTRDLSDRNLGRAINTGMPYLRKNYMFSQLGENDVFGKLNYNLRYFYSFDDGGSQISGVIEWNLLDQLEIFTVGLVNIGDEKSDFKRLISNNVMVGMSYRF
ncbi:hypothetical protein M0D21_12310 [Aquimarina sp. D1M17]|uniref:hypothetical protein n=1 Tax=Aquimarina acroporae TaxID=2937283 RepID=UPI0020C08095|nr:hypothetical protein [Aquimarina acroporae]MCK8522360.1 hypothetical protein [Aquimarina acroporae]